MKSRCAGALLTILPNQVKRLKTLTQTRNVVARGVKYWLLRRQVGIAFERCVRNRAIVARRHWPLDVLFQRAAASSAHHVVRLYRESNGVVVKVGRWESKVAKLITARARAPRLDSRQ